MPIESRRDNHPGDVDRERVLNNLRFHGVRVSEDSQDVSLPVYTLTKGDVVEVQPFSKAHQQASDRAALGKVRDRNGLVLQCTAPMIRPSRPAAAVGGEVLVLRSAAPHHSPHPFSRVMFAPAGIAPLHPATAAATLIAMKTGTSCGSWRAPRRTRSRTSGRRTGRWWNGCTQRRETTGTRCGSGDRASRAPGRRSGKETGQGCDDRRGSARDG